jgi:hypothetical protein
MPCNSDYLNQNPFEASMQHTAKLAVYAGAKCGLSVPPEIIEQSNEYYATDVGQVEWLCETINHMNEGQLNDVVYNGRIPEARQLAEWWDAHQQADREREAYDTEHERLRTLPTRLKERADSLVVDTITRDLLREAAEALGD